MKTNPISKSIPMLFAGIFAVSVVALTGGCNRQETAPSSAASTPPMSTTTAPGTTTMAPVTPPSTTVGTDIDDTIVTTKVKAALVGEPNMKDFDVKVETTKGVVQLAGVVDNQMTIDRAIAVAKNVEGVKSVDNVMTIKSAK